MNSRELVKSGLVLALVAGVCGLVLGGTYALVKPKIELVKDAALKESLGEVLPAASTGFVRKELSGNVTYFVGLSGGETVGYVFDVRSSGYSSAIEVLVGVDSSGVVTGSKVLSQQETPGLGARIVEVRPGEGKPWFTLQFEGKRGVELKLSKDGGKVDAITGATISSRAVAEGVYEAASRLFAEASKAEVGG